MRDLSLSIVVVTFGSLSSASKELRNLADVVAGRADIECIIVDNTNGEELPALGQMFVSENVRFFALENPGFAAACNLGARVACADWVLLLNPDVLLTRSSLDAIIGAARESADCVAISLDTRGRVTMGIDMLPFLWFRDHPVASPRAIIGPSGGAALWRRHSYLRLGGLPSACFAWGEDAYLALAAREQKLRCGQLDVRLAHQGGHSITGHRARVQQKAFLLNRNRVVVARRFLSQRRFVLFVMQHMVMLVVMTPRLLRRRALSAAWHGWRAGLVASGD